MRNKLSVNNVTYYESSYIERGNIKNVLNFKPRRDVILPSTPLIQNVSHRPSYDTNVNELEIKVHNRVKRVYDDSYINHTEFYILNNNTAEIPSYYQNIKYIHVNVKNVLDYNAVVQNKEEQYVNMMNINVDVLDKVIEIENYSEPLLDFFVVKDKTRSLLNTQSKAHNLYIKNGIGMYDEYIYAHNIELNITKRKEEDLGFKTTSTLIVQQDINSISGWEKVPIIEIDVSNVNKGESSSVGSSSSTGTDLKNLYFTIQQMSFFEFKFSFKNKKVQDVFNLPTGLFFEVDRQIIIGTPIKSGKFAFAILFDDSTILNGFIDVPKVTRKL